ncbi:DMT family transporter [Primorskyibacter marinus]|uniref:DMT family transporter n=1 Tax=Primorskyibacter marinus TaxID=1977320 RepID=UPI001E5D0ABE|nr:DMT family transporter [Primorskyibacter marinus]
MSTQTQAAPDLNPVFKAALWMTGAIASFTSMAVAGRAVSFELDTFEIMLYRSIAGIFIVLVVATVAGTRHQITTRSMHLHLVRNISHFTGQNLWFYAVAILPLAQVFALEFTSPLWVVLLSPLILGEKLTKARCIAALFGFVGILIVARPSPDSFDVRLLFATGAAIGFAGSAVFTKLLTRTETITCILFWLVLMQAVFGLICAGLDGEIAVPSAATWPWIALISCAGLVAHFCLTNALRIAPASVVMPFDFLRLPLIALIGMLFYNEPLDIFVILGAVVIFGANYFNILSETRAVAAK